MKQETPTTGFRLRIFAERVFGIPVEAIVTGINRKARTVTLEAHYENQTWKERRSFDYEFMYPSKHNTTDYFNFHLEPEPTKEPHNGK